MQSGVRAAHTCKTAALKVFEDLRAGYNAGHISIICFLNCSKPFDSDTSIDLMKDYLSGRF